MDASTIILYVSRAAALLIAIPFHESAHALTAEMLGDKTGRNSGRISMNPARHFDLFGFLCLMFTGVGWAKPTPVNPSNFKNEKAGMALTALAGPVSNVVLSFLACVLLRVASMTWLLYSGSMESWLYYLMMFFMYFTYINASLAVFNMLPVPPFDGSRIVLAFLPRRIYFGIMKYERYIFIAMFILLYIGVFDKPLSAASQWLVDGELSATKFINGLFGYYGDDIL